MVEDLMREMTTLKDGYTRMDDLERQMKHLMEENNGLKDKINNVSHFTFILKIVTCPNQMMFQQFCYKLWHRYIVHRYTVHDLLLELSRSAC